MTEKEWLKIRDDLWKVLRNAGHQRGKETKDCPTYWFTSAEDVSEEAKRIETFAAQAVAVYALTPLNKRRQELIYKQNHEGGLTEKEQAVFEELDEVFGQCIDRIHPHAPAIEFSDYIKSLIKEMEGG